MKTYAFLILILFSRCALAGDGKTSLKTCEGTLKTGIFAIGGETTGVTLKTKQGAVYELDLGKDASLAKLSETLNGKTVSVTGELQTRTGVETGNRTVIAVTSLKESAKNK